MICNNKTAQPKDICCRDDLGNPIGTVTAARITCRTKPHVDGAAGTIVGHRWQLRLNALHKPWPSKRGIYEWRILDIRTSGVLAVYVGQAKRFEDRLPFYWRDMSPQLVEYLHGGTAITSRGCRRREKYRLRWIHFWLAWAFVEEAPVELILREENGDLSHEEEAQITKVTGGAGNPGRCVNKEALRPTGVPGCVYVDDVVDYFRKCSAAAPPTHVPVPPNWRWHFAFCGGAKPWFDAIDDWSKQHATDFP